jgi:hypothetical protein
MFAKAIVDTKIAARMDDKIVVVIFVYVHLKYY